MTNLGSVLKLRTRAERKATDSPWAQGLARSGLVTRGMIHLVVMAVGAWNGWTGISCRFEKELKRFEMSRGQRSVTVKLGMVGHIARMAAYL